MFTPRRAEVEPAPAEGASTAIVTFQVEGWTLGRLGGAEEPRIRDIDLAERLGYERPRSIRKLIVRVLGPADERGKIPGVQQRSTVERYEIRPGVSHGQEVTEYWLTRAQALKVSARSETPPADALLDEMIHVFELALDGKLPGQVHHLEPHHFDPSMAALLASLVEKQGIEADRRLGRMESLIEKLIAEHRPAPAPPAGERWTSGMATTRGRRAPPARLVLTLRTEPAAMTSARRGRAPRG